MSAGAKKRSTKQLPLGLERRDRAEQRKILHLPKRGRPRKKGAIDHRPRPKLKPDSVLHVTLKLRRGLPALRGRKPASAISRSFSKYAKGDGFRLIHFSVQNDHIHLVLEADSKPRLSAGMQKLMISIARRLNILWSKGRERTGQIFKERYHLHVLKSLAEVRNALVYAFANGAKHGVSGCQDPFSSSAAFDGYKTAPKRMPPPVIDLSMLAKPRSWSLRFGWRRRGLIDPNERPKLE